MVNLHGVIYLIFLSLTLALAPNSSARASYSPPLIGTPLGLYVPINGVLNCPTACIYVSSLLKGTLTATRTSRFDAAAYQEEKWLVSLEFAYPKDDNGLFTYFPLGRATVDWSLNGKSSQCELKGQQLFPLIEPLAGTQISIVRSATNASQIAYQIQLMLPDIEAHAIASCTDDHRQISHRTQYSKVKPEFVMAPPESPLDKIYLQTPFAKDLKGSYSTQLPDGDRMDYEWEFVGSGDTIPLSSMGAR